MAVVVWKTLSALLAVCSAARAQNFTYEANWDSLDARPIPEWYEDAKLGVFIHWGVFSVPSFKSEWFWENWETNDSDVVEFMNANYKPGFTYQDFARDFTAEFYDPDTWANIFQSSGAKYVVLTSKHHEGYTLWPSDYSFSWNAKDVGPARDLIAPLAESIRSNTDLKFGLYHSLLEWYNPLYLQDQANNWTTQDFVNQKTLPELYEIVNAYKPEVIFSDGEWTASSDYFRSKEFLAWLYNESPVKDTVAVNDRWGNDAKCQHGGYFNCDDRLNPGTLMVHKWENAMTIDKSSWGFRRNARLSNILTIEELLNNFVKAVSCNGNMLMNVGPTKEGVIAPIYEERLRQMGTWLDINGEAIYSTRYWSVQNDANNKDVWYTRSKDNSAVYAISLIWPSNRQLTLGSVLLAEDATVTLFGYSRELTWTDTGSEILVDFPQRDLVSSDWAYAIKMVGATSR
uniref:Putative alpha-L-fucosidase n=1 Tax=Timema genevievae TaxID=629358 RepID=A0A7R9PL10_TIMGE|nr:unnamed protein product [Timema genevievae]